MSTDRLREAARVLRERAETVIARDHNPGHAIDNFVAYYEGRRTSSDALGIDAAYIATMHPGVGLALADWLDAQADTTCDCGVDEFALAVADLILGCRQIALETRCPCGCYQDSLTIDRLQERLQAVGDVLFEWQAALDYASANRIDPDPLLTRHVEQIRTAVLGGTR
jgi:hypothetical protein